MIYTLSMQFYNSPFLCSSFFNLKVYLLGIFSCQHTELYLILVIIQYSTEWMLHNLCGHSPAYGLQVLKCYKLFYNENIYTYILLHICEYNCALISRSKNPGLRCMCIFFCDRFLPITLAFNEDAALYALLMSI